MWNSYFYQIRKKYSMRVSTKKPLVINLDGKDLTKDFNIKILDFTEGGFLDILERTVQYFSRKYKCIAIFGADEVSFIFEEPMGLINDMNSDGNTYSSEIISVFSQYFFEYFNHFNLYRKIFWHGKCFSIEKEKIESYLKYKSKLIQVLVTTNFLKNKGIKNAGQISLVEKIEMCSRYDDYKLIKDIEYGIVYKNGVRVKVDDLESKLEIDDIEVDFGDI